MFMKGYGFDSLLVVRHGLTAYLKTSCFRVPSHPHPPGANASAVWLLCRLPTLSLPPYRQPFVSLLPTVPGLTFDDRFACYSAPSYTLLH